MGFWLKQFGRVEYYFGPVSDYVRHHRFNGKRPDPKFNPRDITE
jgi:hypothetical protein